MSVPESVNSTTQRSETIYSFRAMLIRSMFEFSNKYVLRWAKYIPTGFILHLKISYGKIGKNIIYCSA